MSKSKEVSMEPWFALRRLVQIRSEALLGESEAARLLHDGKVWGMPGWSGQYITALLCSQKGCRAVLRLVDALAAGHEVPVAWDEDGRRPVGRTALRLARGKLVRVRPQPHHEQPERV